MKSRNRVVALFVVAILAVATVQFPSLAQQASAPIAIKKDDAPAAKPKKTAESAAGTNAKADEASAPTPEQLAERLQFEWNSISAQAGRNLKSQGLSRSISISGQIKIVNQLDILGLCDDEPLAEAYDDTGQIVARLDADQNKLQRFPKRHYSFPHQLPPQAPWFGALDAIAVSVSLPLKEAAVPNRLRRVTGTISVLAGKTRPPVDIALTKSNEWTELGPGLSIRLAKAEVRDGSFDYQLEGKGDDATTNFYGWVDPQQGLPKSFIATAAVIDEFNQEHEIGHGGSLGPNSSGSAGFGGAGRLMTMRLTVVTDIREIAVPFEIKDLEVPTLGTETKAPKNR